MSALLSRMMVAAGLSLVAVACGSAPTEKSGATGEAETAGVDPTVACVADADCVAVPSATCTDGTMTAVNVDQIAAYYEQHCGDPTSTECNGAPVVDARVAQCIWRRGCTMVAVDKIACHGFAPGAKHECPDGYDCQLRPPGDVPGKCVAHVDAPASGATR